MDKKSLRSFGADQSKILLNMLQSYRIGSSEEADAIVHALVDIAVSIDKVYLDILPGLLNDSETTAENLKERLWDLREEFRHIDYHIHDSKLMDI